jgi:hypothetical protein
MAEQRRQNQNNDNFFAGLFGGSANGGFFAQLIAAISSIFNGNFGGLFSGLFGGKDANGNEQPNILQRGAAAVGRGVDQGTALFGRGVDALKNLIGHHESGNDYNRIYGAGVKRIPLTEMTINEVLAWQDKYVGEGSKSSAAGKYQIIRGTLRELRDQMNLTGNEKFDSQMQDRMFEKLADRRGLGAFQNGRISEATFMRNLSQEWASLPKDNSSLSYYHGDGLNRAHATPASVTRALEEARVATAAPAVQYSEAKRTGQTLSTTPRITSALNNASNAEPAPAPEAPRVSAVAPTPRQVPLMSPSFAMS